MARCYYCRDLCVGSVETDCAFAAFIPTSIPVTLVQAEIAFFLPEILKRFPYITIPLIFFMTFLMVLGSLQCLCLAPDEDGSVVRDGRKLSEPLSQWALLFSLLTGNRN